VVLTVRGLDIHRCEDDQACGVK